MIMAGSNMSCTPGPMATWPHPVRLGSSQLGSPSPLPHPPSAHPLFLKEPIRPTLCAESTVSKHNVSLHVSLDQPVYFLEDKPIQVKAKIVRLSMAGSHDDSIL